MLVESQEVSQSKRTLGLRYTQGKEGTPFFRSIWLRRGLFPPFLRFPTGPVPQKSKTRPTMKLFVFACLVAVVVANEWSSCGDASYHFQVGWTCVCAVICMAQYSRCRNRCPKSPQGGVPVFFVRPCCHGLHGILCLVCSTPAKGKVFDIQVDGTLGKP